MKNPLTPAGIEPATYRFVAQHLNYCATAVPNWTGTGCNIVMKYTCQCLYPIICAYSVMFFGVRAHYNPALYDHTAFFFNLQNWLRNYDWVKNEPPKLCLTHTCLFTSVMIHLPDTWHVTSVRQAVVAVGHTGPNDSSFYCFACLFILSSYLVTYQHRSSTTLDISDPSKYILILYWEASFPAFE